MTAHSSVITTLDYNDLHALYLSPVFYLVVKSRRIRRVGTWHVLGEKETERKSLVGKPRGFVIKKYIGMAWTGFIWLRLDTSDGLL